MIRPQHHFRMQDGQLLAWNVRKLAETAAALPIVDHPLGAIAEIDAPYWFEATSDAPTCRAVIAHARQTNAADLRYPILLCAEGRVMDGMHRVMKALGEGRTTIRARRFDTTPPPDHVDVPPAELND